MQTTNQIHQRRETTELSTYELRNGVGYSTPNEQRGYTPPPTPEPFTPPRVSASAVKVDGSVVEQAHASFTHAKTAFEKFLNDIPREHRACGMSMWCARRRVRDRLMSHEHLVRAKGDRWLSSRPKRNLVYWLVDCPRLSVVMAGCGRGSTSCLAAARIIECPC